jgi:hypothetical protein
MYVIDIREQQPIDAEATISVIKALSTDLTVGESLNGDHVYDYNEKTFIATSGDRLTFRLNPKFHTAGKSAYFRAFCCSDSNAIRPVGTQPPSALTPPFLSFPAGTREVTFEINTGLNQLIHIGMIVRIEHMENGVKVTKDLLCDPQVGNDPP